MLTAKPIGRSVRLYDWSTSSRWAVSNDHDDSRATCRRARPAPSRVLADAHKIGRSRTACGESRTEIHLMCEQG
jgi:hypothetical protein